MKFPKVLLLASMFFTSFSLQPATSKPHNNFTDLESLLAFKSLADPNGILDANWTTNTTFCSWIGVQCSSRRQRVTIIRLRDLSLKGTISPHLGNLSFLTQLHLGSNTLSGHIPEAISQLHRLTYLNLSRNSLSGPIPLGFAQCQDLQALSLSYNRLTGTIPTEIDSFPKLTILYLGMNELTGTIPNSLGNLTKLINLDLSHNNLTGVIPRELGIPNLTTLYLGTNQLTGTIPNSLGNLTKLINLDLSWNNLTGVIPRELGNLPNLQYLHMGNNNLFGQIPTFLFNDSMLYYFDVDGNKLSGSVPVGIGTSLPLLQTFRLQENQLTGGLIFLLSLSNCKGLQIVAIRGNKLEEYATTGTISRMSDVYSFGILLLETFTGKKPVDDMFSGESNLREWVSKALPNAIFDVIDYKLLKDCSNDDGPLQDQTIIHQCLLSIIELGLLCSAYTPKERIKMTDVAARLRKIKVEYLSNLSN